MSDLVGTPNCWFSHAQAHFIFNVKKVLMIREAKRKPLISCLFTASGNNFTIYSIMNVKYVFVQSNE